MIPTCPYCLQPAVKASTSEIYPGRKSFSEAFFWVCHKCDARVGCHPNTDKPLGTLATISTRRARQATHSAFDRIWKAEMLSQGISKRKARNSAYQWLAGQLGTRSNIGEMD